MWWPFGKMKKINCPDGTERLVYKNPDDAFPLFAKDSSAKFDSIIKATKELQGKLGASYQNHIKGFLTQIDQANSNMQINLRALYVIYSLNPCNNDKMVTEEVRNLICKENIFRRIQYEIDFINCLLSKKAPPEAINKAIETSSRRLSQPTLVYETSEAFEKAEKDVKAWEEKE